MKTGNWELPATSLHDVDQVLEAITVMANGWFLLGYNRVTSALPPQSGKKVGQSQNGG